MNNFVFSLLILVAILPFSSVASEIVECNNCYNYEAAAKTKAASVNRDEVEVDVYDFGRGQLKRFKVIKMIEPGISFFNSYELTVSSSRLAEFQLATAKLDEIKAITARNYIVSGAESAYDLIGNSALQREVTAEYMQHANLEETFEIYAATVLNVLGQIVNTNFFITLEFSDGSTADFKIHGIDADSNIVFSFMEAVDSDNNTIPDSSSDYNGKVYTMTYQNWIKFFRNAELLHKINFVYNKSNTTPKRITCSKLPDGSIQCTEQD